MLASVVYREVVSDNVLLYYTISAIIRVKSYSGGIYVLTGFLFLSALLFVSVCVARVCRRVSILPLAYLKNTSRRIRAIQVPIMSLSA